MSQSNLNKFMCRYGPLVVIFCLVVTLYVYSARKPRVIAEANLKTETLCDSGDAQLFLVSAVNSTAKCLDGSKPAYYYRKGRGNGLNKWIVFFEGGGWCYDLEQCRLRSLTILGSSAHYYKCLSAEGLGSFYISSDVSRNPMMYNWNTVLVKYCDGSSFAGDATVEYKGKHLHFRGKENRDQIIRSLLLRRGMNHASEIVIGGCSAGALGIYFGLDQMASIIHTHNPSTSVRGMPDSGYFMEYTSTSHVSVTHKGLGKDEASVNGIMDYASAMRTVYEYTNMEAGVHPDCVAAEHTKAVLEGRMKNSSNCVFAKNIVPFIQTPLFALQPQYDQWQILHVLDKNFTNEQVNEFGANLTNSLKSTLFAPRLIKGNTDGTTQSIPSPHGAFVESCAHHCTSCSSGKMDTWNGKQLVSSTEQMNEATAFATWYQNSLPQKYTTDTDKTASVVGSAINSSTNFYFQDRKFPCVDCCTCMVYH